MGNSKYLGIDIGSYSIKIALLDKLKDGFAVKKSEEIVIPMDLDVERNEWIRDQIRDYCKDNKLSKYPVSVSLPCDISHVAVKFHEMPKLKKKELAVSMKYEIEEKTIMPDAGGVSYKWEITNIGEENLAIMSAIMDKNLLADVSTIIPRRLKFVEPEIITAGRLIDGNQCVIDFGHKGTRFMAYKDGYPYFYQFINTGGETLTNKIAEKYLNTVGEIPPRVLEQADALKIKHGAVLKGLDELDIDSTTKDISDIIFENVFTLINEIKQALRILEIKHNYKPENIYFYGGAAKLKYLQAYANKELGFDLVNLDYELKGFSSDDSIDYYTVIQAAGSSLVKEYPFLKNSINFTSRQKLELNYEGILLGIVAFSIVMNAGLFGAIKVYEKKAKQVNDDATSMQKKVDEINARIKSNQKQTTAYDNFVNNISTVASKDSRMSSMFAILPTYTPKGVSITYMDMTNKKILIKGYATNYSQIGFYAISLKSMGTVVIDSITETTGGANPIKYPQEFQISITF